MIKKWQVDFYFSFLILKLMKSKYTGWVFTREFKLNYAINQVRTIVTTLENKVSRGDKL